MGKLMDEVCRPGCECLSIQETHDQTITQAQIMKLQSGFHSAFGWSFFLLLPSLTAQIY